jgi:hypothetical protein
MVDSDRPQMTICDMYFTCWITRATGICSEYVIKKVKKSHYRPGVAQRVPGS